ncbi:MAG: O-linked N-acetylglucosamine transferase, SPINDLY family protein [Sulfuricaulis sp.]
MTKKNIQMHVRKRQVQALLQSNRLQEAKILLTEMRDLDGGDAETWFLLGVIYGKNGSAVSAEPCLRKAVELSPNHSPARYNLGIALRDLGKLQEAADCLHEVTRIKPDYVEAYSSLGFVLLSLMQREEAIHAFKQVVRLQPEAAEAHANLGSALYIAGHLEESVSRFRRAIKLKPVCGAFYDPLGTVLCCQGKAEEAIASHREALRLQPDEPTSHSNLLFTMQYNPPIDPAESLTEHRRWAEKHGGGNSLPVDSYANNKDPIRRLRVGYVSPDFREHSVAYFIEPLLGKHDPAAFDIFCYADVKRADATTHRLQSLAHHWRSISRLSHDQLANTIRADGIDILVDLAGHTGGNRLPVFARKPAPIQVTYLGYPNTTGLATMDYRLTDSRADPTAQHDTYYSERLVRLDPGFLCYQPPADAPAVAPAPCEGHGYITFGSFNNLSKISSETIALWARILHTIPTGQLVLKYHWLSDTATRERYYGLFAEHDIPRERVQVFGMAPTTAEHLSMYSRIDIALDPFPYNGTTTTCEALWMGVPVITLAGRAHASRVGASLLSQVGLTELVAETADQYLATAVSLADNRATLVQLRAGLRAKVASSTLCDSQSFARRVEAAYRTMWEKWCAARHG